MAEKDMRPSVGRSGDAGTSSATGTPLPAGRTRYGSFCAQLGYLLLSFVRTPAALFWTLAFPMLMATLFMLMFSGIDDYYAGHVIDVAVVADDNYESDAATALRETLEAVSEEGDGQLLDLTIVDSVAEGAELAREGTVEGVISVDASGAPSLAVSASGSSINQSIVQMLLSRVEQTSAAVEAAIAANPAAFATSEDIAASIALFTGSAGSADSTQELDVLRTEPNGMARYYYAIIGFTSVQCTSLGIIAMSYALPYGSASGMRRRLGGMTQGSLLGASVVAAFICGFACSLGGFAYMRFVLGIEFGGRDALALLALAACSLMGTGLGTLIGSVPGLSFSARTGISTLLTCGLSLFAGLYGESSMQLADWLAANAPLAQLLNPAVQASTVFYQLAYYDSLAPFLGTVGVLCAMAAACFAAASLFMRRQRYAAL